MKDKPTTRRRKMRSPTSTPLRAIDPRWPAGLVTDLHPALASNLDEAMLRALLHALPSRAGGRSS